MKIVALLFVLVVGASACSTSTPDPDEARRQRVQDRLEQSFTAAQARCIIDAVDQPTLIALDGTAALEADSPAIDRYTLAVVSCVTDPGGSGAPTTPTAAPASTTTTTTAGG